MCLGCQSGPDLFENSRKSSLKCLQPYHVECTSSRLITEVKQHWAELVLGWVTAWEHSVLLASSFWLEKGRKECAGKSSMQSQVLVLRRARKFDSSSV